MLEAAHLTVDEPPVALDELAHEVGAAERDGREDGGLGAAGEQELGHLLLHVLEAGRPADDVHLVVVALAVDVGAGLEQALRDGEVSLRDGPVQGGGAIELVAQVHVEAEPEQQLDALEVPAIRRKVQQRHAPLAAGDADLRGMFGEQAGEFRRVSLDGGGHDLAVEAETFDMRLQRAPALEAVFPGDVELRLMQFRGGVACAQLLEPLLGGLLQPFEVGARRESLGHRTPSFSSARCPQPTGKKEDVKHIEMGGGFNPSRGPSAACSAKRHYRRRRGEVKCVRRGGVPPPGARDAHLRWSAKVEGARALAGNLMRVKV